MSAAEIDSYLRALDEPKRATLQALRATILEILPEAEQVISYRVPAFRVQGKVVAKPQRGRGLLRTLWGGWMRRLGGAAASLMHDPIVKGSEASPTLEEA